MADDDVTRESLLSTWVKAIAHPSALYRDDASGKRPAEPHVFAIVLGVFAAVVGGAVDGLLSRKPGALVGVLSAAIVSPLVTLFSVYLTAALVHFWILVVRGRRGTFRDTVAASCYARAPLVFVVVPLLGVLVGYAWHVVAMCIGLKHSQRTTIGRAIFAVIAGSPVLLALLLRVAVVEAFKIQSGAMVPSLMVGDHLFVSKLAFGPLIPSTDARLFSRLPPDRGDVMVFKFPENKEQDFIFRAIALPGDTVEAINGRPVINGWLVPHCRVGPFHYENRTAELFVEYLGDRSYLTLFDTDPDEQPCKGEDCTAAGRLCRGGICGLHEGPFQVARDEVWVMGDNRNNSYDSRSWAGGRGAGVPFENIKGRVMFVWMSYGPGGGIAVDRLFLGLRGAPALPGAGAAIQDAIATCLRERPPPAQTTPPREAAPR